MRRRALATASLSRKYGLRPGRFVGGGNRIAREITLAGSRLFARSLTAFGLLALLLASGEVTAQPRPEAPVGGPTTGQGQPTPPPQGTSRGENFSAKPPAALFASDCTGAGCHRGPQG